ncbi:putative transcription factor homeobox-WOX family [Dioscorea sansibarensis]
MLENSFRENNILNGNQKQELARKLDLQVRQVEVWFQNRRARYCQSLSEENKRLKKELQALKLARPPSSSLFLQISKQTKISAEGDGKSSASSDSMSDKSRIYNRS